MIRAILIHYWMSTSSVKTEGKELKEVAVKSGDESERRDSRELRRMIVTSKEPVRALHTFHIDSTILPFLPLTVSLPFLHYLTPPYSTFIHQFQKPWISMRISWFKIYLRQDSQELFLPLSWTKKRQEKEETENGGTWGITSLSLHLSFSPIFKKKKKIPCLHKSSSMHYHHGMWKSAGASEDPEGVPGESPLDQSGLSFILLFQR